MNVLPLFPFSVNRVMALVARRQASAITSVASATRLAGLSTKMRRVAVTGGSIMALLSLRAAHCAEKGSEISEAVEKVVESVKHAVEDTLGGGSGGDPFKNIVDKYAGLAQQLGFSGLMGLCSAMALKKVSKQAAIAVGFVFGGLQALAYMGYININYKKVTDDAQKAMDVTGDGKFDAEDIKTIWKHLYDILSHGLPAAGSFSTGFALGFYYL